MGSVRIERWGGVTGRRRVWVVDPLFLSPRARARLTGPPRPGSLRPGSLRPERPRPGPARDLVQYRFTLIRGRRRQSLVFDDFTLPRDLRAAVDRAARDA